MSKRIFSLVLTFLLINFVCSAQTAVQPNDNKEVGKIYSTVFRLGVDGSRLVKVTLRDGTVVKGYIREINDDDFVLVGEETGKVNRLAYQQVKDVKRSESRVRKVGNVLGYVLFFGVIGAMAVGYMRK